MNNLIKKYHISSFLLGMIFVLCIAEIAGMSLLRKYNYFFRAISIQDMSKLEYAFPYETPQELQQLCGNTFKDTLKNVMNFVRCIHKDRAPLGDHVQDFFNCAQQGGSLTCNGMAELYLHALRLQGIKARKLFVVKNFGDPYQSHTIVEIFINGKWCIFDPTFHVSFEKNGELVGAQDISQALFDGSYNQIKPIFYGEVAYRNRLKTYYMDWLSLYNNVLFFTNSMVHYSYVKKLLAIPLRYWNGPILYYYSYDGVPNSYFMLMNSMYFAIVCIIPLSIGFLVFLLMLIMLMVLIKNKNIYRKKG